MGLCGRIEKETALIYRALEVRFPDAREVFNRLAMSEENHSELVEKAILSHKEGVLPPQFVPGSTLELEHTLYHLERTKKLLSGDPGLGEACALALELEELVGEKYLQEVIGGKIEVELDKKMSGLLHTLSEEEKEHSRIIRDFMASRDLTGHE